MAEEDHYEWASPEFMMDEACDLGRFLPVGQVCPYYEDSDPDLVWAFDLGRREKQHMSRKPPDNKWRFRVEEQK